MDGFAWSVMVTRHLDVFLKLLFATFLVALPFAAFAENDPARACREDAMLVLDGSGSMSAADFSGGFVSRISRVKEALGLVLPRITAKRNVGLMVYGPGANRSCSNIELRLPPQNNSAAQIMAEVNNVLPSGSTPLTAAVHLAAQELNFTQRPAVVVLLTDGEDTCGGAPCEMVEHLRNWSHDLTIHVIGYLARKGHGTPGKFTSRCMAERTGGLYVSVETREELVEALQKTLGCQMVSALTRE